MLSNARTVRSCTVLRLHGVVLTFTFMYLIYLFHVLCFEFGFLRQLIGAYKSGGLCN